MEERHDIDINWIESGHKSVPVSIALPERTYVEVERVWVYIIRVYVDEPLHKLQVPVGRLPRAGETIEVPDRPGHVQRYTVYDIVHHLNPDPDEQHVRLYVR